MSKAKCVNLIKCIYEKGKDVTLPCRAGAIPITILGSKSGYYLQANLEPKKYANAEEVFEALYTCCEFYEKEPLPSLLQDLQHVC